MTTIRRPLSEFFEALRVSGVEVSPVEAMDAFNGVAVAGYADRTRMRDTLCATLVKSADDIPSFERCFDVFFASRPSARAAANLSSHTAGAPDLAEMMLAGDADAIALAIEAAAQRAGLAQMRYRAQRGFFISRLLREMGLPDVDRLIAARAGDGNHATSDPLSAARERLMHDVRSVVMRQEELFAGATARAQREERLSDTPLANIQPHEMATMRQLVRRMARKLAARYGRRRLRARRGDLDVRQTLRRSMAYGGVAFEPAWKRRVISKPSIVVICDVSRSVASVARFLLLFLYALNEAVEKLDAFAFSDRLIAIDKILDGNDIEAAIDGTLTSIGFRSTDYGQAFQDFVDNHFDCVDRRTTIIILGDGRTNGADPRLDLVGAIAARSRGILWLNPESERSWGAGDSEMPAYRRFCQKAVTCASVADLETVIDQMMSAYH